MITFDLRNSFSIRTQLLYHAALGLLGFVLSVRFVRIVLELTAAWMVGLGLVFLRR